MGRILVVDDEPHMRRILASNLSHDAHVVSEAGTVDEARRCVGTNTYESVFTDQRMPDGEGLDVLSAAREADPSVSVVMLTAVATVELAVEAMRRGAFDFLTKPFDHDVLMATARRACERTALVRENVWLKGEVCRLEGMSDIVGSSPPMRVLRELISRVAPTNATVLITGETGTGKELVARAIHKGSARADRPFVAVNCAAFSETLLESELFGHEKGAFTGADHTHQGFFEAAHGGTLFLDEAGELSQAAQAKLLRIVTDGQLLRVGSTRPRTIDVRVLVATHRELKARVREGLFREDLYYRLAVVPIHLPALRERREDLPALCDRFAREVAMDLKILQRGITPAAIAVLQRYHFPGNVRELRNLIERAYILSGEGDLGPDNFLVPGTGADTEANGITGGSAGPGTLPERVNLPEYLDQMEKSLVERMLEAAGGRQAEAARRLGISRSVLSYKLTKYGIRAAGE